jgi:hypothetical protein
MENAAGIFELLLVFGGILGFGFWELYSLKRDRKRRAREGEKQDPPV